MKTTKKNVLEAHKSGPRAEAIRRACTYHVTQSSRIIKSLGLSVADFNLITRRLAHDAVLRKKVSRKEGKREGVGGMPRAPVLFEVLTSFLLGGVSFLREGSEAGLLVPAGKSGQ